MSMMYLRFVRCVFSVLVLSVVFANIVSAEKPKNIIIMIDDGMGRVETLTTPALRDILPFPL